MRVAVLVSGSGTILASMLSAGIDLHLVVADRACAGLDRAAAAGIAAEEISRTSFSAAFDRGAYTQRVTQRLVDHQIALVAMAGFGTILGPSIYEHFGGRILNTHPALLPSFPGWHAVEDALAAGVKVTGCTLHVATAAVDSGPIIAQHAVPVLASDTADSLHERIKVAERQMYVDSLQTIIAQRFVLTPGDIDAPSTSAAAPTTRTAKTTTETGGA